MYVHMYVHVYIHNTKESLALNLEIGKTNWHSTVIANIRTSALSLALLGFSSHADKWLTQLNFGQQYSCFVRKMADGRQLFLALYTYMQWCSYIQQQYSCIVNGYCIQQPPAHSGKARVYMVKAATYLQSVMVTVSQQAPVYNGHSSHLSTMVTAATCLQWSQQAPVYNGHSRHLSTMVTVSQRAPVYNGQSRHLSTMVTVSQQAPVYNGQSRHLSTMVTVSQQAPVYNGQSRHLSTMVTAGTCLQWSKQAPVYNGHCVTAGTCLQWSKQAPVYNGHCVTAGTCQQQLPGVPSCAYFTCSRFHLVQKKPKKAIILRLMINDAW